MNKGKRILCLCLSLLTVLSLSGCGIPFVQRRGINLIAPALPNSVKAIMKQRSERLAREGLPGNIILISSLAEMSPRNFTLLWTAAQSYTSYGMLVEDEDPEYASGLYLIAKDYGMRALQRNPKFRRTIKEKGIGGIPAIVKELGKRYVPAMFWTSMAWGSYMFLNLDDPTAPIGLPLVLAMIQRVKELNPRYFFGGAHLFYIAYYSTLPTFMGGGPKKVEEEYRSCLSVTDGDFLLPYVYYAKFYAVKYDRKDLFEASLNKVLEVPSDTRAELTLVNEIAKGKARRLLERKEELFPY